MITFQNATDLTVNLNALFGGLFLVVTISIVISRQVRATLMFFILQSLILALSALLLGIKPFSIHLIFICIINLITKVWILPLLLRRFVPGKIYTRREINQVLNIPTSLLITLVLIVVSYLISQPWLSAVPTSGITQINLPIGLAGLLLGAFTLTVRREAVPQLLGVLVMENGVFFAGIAIAADLPVFAELAMAFDVLMVVFIMAILTRTVHETIGTTSVGHLTNLREEPHK